MPTIFEKYEAELRRKLAAVNKRIKKVYEGGISEIQATISAVNYKGKAFALKDYPALKNKIDKVTAGMHGSIYAINVNGIKESWDLSNQKNNVLADKRLAKSKVPKSVKQVIYDPNKPALEAFIKRKEAGLDLSGRIWKNLDPFKKELEQAIGLGLGAGRPAADIARDIKRYLNEPDKLFRKVRGEDGQLHLSAAARNYHPGQGVYRSSYKNALRLSRTETNDAYRSSDFARWQNMPFVTGIEVRLSNAHPRYDICDKLVGEYPKDFKFRGWHPQCLCSATPKMMSDKEFEKLEDQVLNGESIDDVVSKDAVLGPPKGFNDFVRQNKERIDGWKNKPYWMKDNPQAVKDAIEDIKPFDTKEAIRANIKAASMEGKDSFEFYRNASGDFTAARKELHNKIIDDILSEGSTDTGFVYNLGGAPANGKSTLIDSGQLAHPDGVLKIDPDKIKARLPEYKAMIDAKDSRAAAFAHEESSHIAKRISEKALARNFDLLNDGVGDGEFDKLAAKIQRYQDAGKKVRADYVTLDTDLSVKLAEARAQKTGREVPMQYILDMNREIANLVPKLIESNTFDELYLWDTNVNGKPRLILSQVKGKLKVNDWKLYNNFLKKRHG